MTREEMLETLILYQRQELKYVHSVLESKFLEIEELKITEKRLNESIKEKDSEILKFKENYNSYVEEKDDEVIIIENDA